MNVADTRDYRGNEGVDVDKGHRTKSRWPQRRIPTLSDTLPQKLFLTTHYRQPFCSRPKPVEQRFLPAMTLPRMSIPRQATSNLMVGAVIRPFFPPSEPCFP